MVEKELSFTDLHISLSEIYEAMGYVDAVPDDAVIGEVRTLVERATPIIRPRFSFFIAEGTLSSEQEALVVGEVTFPVGKIIARQLRGAENFVFFAATAGMEFESFQHELQQEGDMVQLYIADSLGSIIAEKAADRMEEAVTDFIRDKGWKHTNRFSPGYCGWHVSHQQNLFSLFPVAEPCGIRLTDSCLMIPIKSVSGVLGLGNEVRKLDYTCRLCTYKKCYRRKLHHS